MIDIKIYYCAPITARNSITVHQLLRVYFYYYITSNYFSLDATYKALKLSEKVVHMYIHLFGYYRIQKIFRFKEIRLYNLIVWIGIT